MVESNLKGTAKWGVAGSVLDMDVPVGGWVGGRWGGEGIRKRLAAYRAVLRKREKWVL